MYKLKFEATTEGKESFELCYQAIVLTQRQIAVSEWDDCVGLLSKFKVAGKDEGTKLGQTVLLDLPKGGCVINLERSEKKLLLDLIEQPIWRPTALGSVRNVRIWLQSNLVEETDGKS